MHKETEIKLRATPATLAALREHPLLKARGADWQTHDLLNQYYDTAASDLARHKVALRVRRDGADFIQTLKTRGQSVAGLSERNEWNWPLPDTELAVEHLDDQCWPASLAGLDKQSLQPIFRTDFQRCKADIRWEAEGSEVEIEAALDQGQVSSPDSDGEAICELELELRAGPPEALLELALTLARELPLMPCDISKAERGYRLHDAQSFQVSLPQPELSATQSLDQTLECLLQTLLGNSQRLAEQFRHTGHWNQLREWGQQLIEMRSLLGSAGQAVPRASTREIRQLLDALLDDWKPVLVQGQQDPELRQAAHQRFLQELDGTRWGEFSLTLALWLHRKSWISARTERGSRQGQAETGRWLERYLKEEAASLNLPHYEGRPSELGEQLPRLERMLSWLHLARQTLEIPEADRLYGELNNLHGLLLDATPDSPETRIATQLEQMALIRTLSGWKALR